MQITPTFASQVALKASSPSSGTDITGGDNSQDLFISLLTAQLKSQDPLSPMDPTAFVGQLVQFNTLGQLMQIRQILQGSTTGATATKEVA